MATSRQPAGHDLVERYFKAMRSGSEALDEMVSLFAPDGEYVEPFSAGGQPQRAPRRGRHRPFFRSHSAVRWATLCSSRWTV
jgi:ketosteroid isomerase-like protein